MTSLLLVLTAALAGPPRSVEGGDGGIYGVALSTRTGLFIGAGATRESTIFGAGPVAEGMVTLNNRYAAGIRLDGFGVVGVQFRGNPTLTEFHILTGVLPKFEYLHGEKMIKSVVGGAIGGYAVNSSTIVGDQFGTITGNGFAVGLIPEAGVDFGPFRISATARFAIGPAGVPPVFGLEFTGVPWAYILPM